MLPVDVEVNVTVSSVSGEAGDQVKSAAPGAASAAGGSTSANATPRAVAAPSIGRRMRRCRPTPIIETASQSTPRLGSVKELRTHWHRTFSQTAWSGRSYERSLVRIPRTGARFVTISAITTALAPRHIRLLIEWRHIWSLHTAPLK